MAAFSALRLAKFNLDERQAMGFIGLPTPANALFWGSFLLGAASLLESSPYMVFVGTLHAEEGCALYDEIARGRFRENTLRQLLDEEKQLLSGISAETAFFGTHPSNAVPLFGALPSDVGVMLDKISAFEDSAPASVLDSVPSKGEEGAIIL